MDPTVVSHPHPAGERPDAFDGSSEVDSNPITPNPETNGDGDSARPAALKEDKRQKQRYVRTHAQRLLAWGAGRSTAPIRSHSARHILTPDRSIVRCFIYKEV